MTRRPPRHGMPPLSRASGELHVYAMLHSLTKGTPGFVDDGYLDSLYPDPILRILELAVAKLWMRADGGYVIDEDEVARVVLIIDRQLNTLEYRHRR